MINAQNSYMYTLIHNHKQLSGFSEVREVNTELYIMCNIIDNT